MHRLPEMSKHEQREKDTISIPSQIWATTGNVSLSLGLNKKVDGFSKTHTIHVNHLYTLCFHRTLPL